MLWVVGSNPAGITIETKNIRSSNELLIFFIHIKAIRRISNPSPNLEPKSFLHAYSAIIPLAQDGHRQPNL